jgi:excinuclease ABC subunit A
MEVDPELVVPDDEKSLDEGAIAPWSVAPRRDYFTGLIDALAKDAGFSTKAVAQCGGARSLLYRVPGQVHVATRNRYGASAATTQVRGRVPTSSAARRGGDDTAGSASRLHARGAVQACKGAG